MDGWNTAANIGTSSYLNGKGEKSPQATGDGPERPGKGQKATGPTNTLSTIKPVSDNTDSVIAGGITLSGALAADDITGVGVFDDPLIPVILAGTAIYAAVQTNVVQKMADEIDNLVKKATGPQGFTYEIRVRAPGTYLDVRGNPVTLGAGGIWKYGETTKGSSRYSQSDLNRMVPGAGAYMTPIYYGNQTQIKIFEKYLIYGYFFNHGELPPGNRIFR